ncbi:hypothetical protein [Methylobacterium currus]|uniref:hypothetical protein n=1 Tax=Methylobacterium currus TaxID=2051553 RepID=UPI000F51172F|nr:hypothetical protein [Methylobacterium currus]
MPLPLEAAASLLCHFGGDGENVTSLLLMIMELIIMKTHAWRDYMKCLRLSGSLAETTASSA